MVSAKITRVAKQLEDLQMNHDSKYGVCNGTRNSCPQELLEVKDGNDDAGLPQTSFKNPGAVVAKILQEAKARRLAVASAPSKAEIPEFVSLQ